MVMVAFSMRTPGQHAEMMRVEMPVVPRLEEYVFFPDGVGGYVHSVDYEIIVGPPSDLVVRILLRP